MDICCSYSFRTTNSLNDDSDFLANCLSISDSFVVARVVGATGASAAAAVASCVVFAVDEVELFAVVVVTIELFEFCLAIASINGHLIDSVEAVLASDNDALLPIILVESFSVLEFLLAKSANCVCCFNIERIALAWVILSSICLICESNRGQSAVLICLKFGTPTNAC